MKIFFKASIVFVTLVILFAIGYYLLAPKPAKTSPDEAIATASFYDLEDKVQPLAQWKGQVLVVNFWGTWCPPCRAEIPEFIRFQKQYAKQGIQLVGIAIDQKSKAQAYASEIGMNYPILLGDLAGIDLAKRLGNETGGLPYTVIVDRNGKVQFSHIGKLNFDMLVEATKPLL